MKRLLLVLFLGAGTLLFGAAERVQFAPEVATWGLQMFMNNHIMQKSVFFPIKLKQDLAEKGWQDFLDANPKITADAFEHLGAFGLPQGIFPSIKEAQDAFAVAAAHPHNLDLWKREYALFVPEWKFFAELHMAAVGVNFGDIPAEQKEEAWYNCFGALCAASLIRMNKRYELMGPELYAQFIEAIDTGLWALEIF